MLKTIKKQLKIILKLIPGYYFIRLNKKGNLTIKKFRFSLRSHRFKLFDFLLERVPEVFENGKMHKNYMKNMEACKSDNNTTKALEIVHEVIGLNKFETHVKLDKFSLKEAINTKICRIRAWIQSKKSLIDRHPEITVITTVKESVSKALKVGENGIVGIISTGNKAFDDQFQLIRRYNNLAVG